MADRWQEVVRDVVQDERRKRGGLSCKLGQTLCLEGCPGLCGDAGPGVHVRECLDGVSFVAELLLDLFSVL